MFYLHYEHYFKIGNTIFQYFRQAVQSLGPVYILVKCAGFAIPKTFENLSIEEERKQIELNFFGSTKDMLPTLLCYERTLQRTRSHFD